MRILAPTGERFAWIIPTPSTPSSKVFFAVEQYTPDYVAPLLIRLRQCYGRSQWHIRWGAEEERHADLWRNTVLALRRRTLTWVEDYSESLRRKDWRLPWNSPLQMVFYQVIQERATQVAYQNLGYALSGKSPGLRTLPDHVLAQICFLIAADEAAHFDFFVGVARLLLYYQPEQAIPAFFEVLRGFSMPARDIIPEYEVFGRTLHEAGVFGKAAHYREVVSVVLKTLCLPPLREAEARLNVAREVLPADARHTTLLLNTVDLPLLTAKVRTLVERNHSHCVEVGLAGLVSNKWAPAWRTDEHEL